MSRTTDLAWAAGLFEGEGTVCTRRARAVHGARGLYASHLAALVMTDEDVVRRFAKIIRVGKVYGPYGPYGGSTKVIWRWQANGTAAVEEVKKQLLPMLGERRAAQFEALLSSGRIEECQS